MNDDTRTSRWLPLLAIVLAAGCGDRATDDGYTFEFCEDHRVQSATCTGGLCDPAPFTKCDDGSCVLVPEQCPSGQPSPTFEYCDAGEIKTTPCEKGICDPAPFEDCGDGSCALSPESCPATAALTLEKLADPTRVVSCTGDADCCIAFDFCLSMAFVISTSQKETVDTLIRTTEHDVCHDCGGDVPGVWVGCESGHCVGRLVLGSVRPKPDGSYDEACDGFFGGCFADPLPPTCPLDEGPTGGPSFVTHCT